MLSEEMNLQIEMAGTDRACMMLVCINGCEGILERPSERSDGFFLLKNKRKSAANEKNTH